MILKDSCKNFWRKKWNDCISEQLEGLGDKKKHQFLVHSNWGQLEPFVRCANISDDSTLSATCGST